MMGKERILVTGSRGFIGTHLVNSLLGGSDRTVAGVGRSPTGRVRWWNTGRNVELVEWVGDLTSESFVRQLMEVVNPHRIFHLAGNPTTRATAEDPHGHELWAANVGTTHNLLAHSPEGCQFVLASSSAVYGDMAEHGARCPEWWSPRPTSLYGASKAAAETLVMTYHRQKKIRGLILRYVANVGTGNKHGLLTDVVRKLRSGVPDLELLGDSPGSVKPYMHVADTAEATARLAVRDEIGVWNVAPDDSISVEVVAAEAMSALRVRNPVRWLGRAANWPGDNPAVRLDNAKLKTCGFVPRFASSGAAVYRAAVEMGGCDDQRN